MLRKIFTKIGVVIAISVVGSIDSDVTHTETTEFHFVENDNIDICVGYIYDGVNYLPQEQTAEQLASIKAAKWETIKSIRDRKVQQGGYKVTVNGTAKWFHSDTFSRTQQMGLVMFGAACPSVPWKTMDGSYVIMSQTLAGQIFTAAATQDQLLFSKAEALKVLVDASSTPDTVDIVTGWPETYMGI